MNKLTQSKQSPYFGLESTFRVDKMTFTSISHFGRSKRYYMRIQGIDVRISKDIFQQVKRIVEGW